MASDGPTRLNDEQFAKLDAAQRLEYCRQFPQRERLPHGRRHDDAKCWRGGILVAEIGAAGGNTNCNSSPPPTRHPPKQLCVGDFDVVC